VDERVHCVRIAAVVSLLLSVAAIALAQTVAGSLEVQIFDPQRAVIPGASVTVRNSAQGTTREVKAGKNGIARIDGLEPGAYAVTITASEFQTAQTQVAIRVGEVSSFTWQLSVAGPDLVEVNVTDRVPDLTTTVIGNPVSFRQIDETPLANRSFANIAYIAPMTAPVEPSDPTKARITAVSFAGSSGLNVDLSVDGGDNNDDYIGGFLQNFSPESIREFNVRTAQFEPDTSRTNGGSIIISRRPQCAQ
jgi:hypothetical protein